MLKFLANMGNAVRIGLLLGVLAALTLYAIQTGAQYREKTWSDNAREFTKQLGVAKDEAYDRYRRSGRWASERDPVAKSESIQAEEAYWRAFENFEGGQPLTMTDTSAKTTWAVVMVAYVCLVLLAQLIEKNRTA